MQMGAGKERSPSPMAEGKAERQRHRSQSPSNYHLQREELLGYNENIHINIPHGTLAETNNPKVFSSPKKIREVLEPPPKQTRHRLKSPVTQSHVSPTLDSVANRVSLRRSPRKEGFVEDFPIQEEILPLVPFKRTSGSKGKDKSPHNSSRLRPEMVSIEEEQVELDLRQKNSKGDEADLQEKGASQVERQYSRGGRSTRRLRLELQEVAEGGDNVGGTEVVGRAARRGQSKTHGRQHKRKAPDPTLPAAVPMAMNVDKSNGQCLVMPRSSSQPRKSRRVPEAKVPQERTNWLQYMADLVMWRDTPKSSFVFGFGSFCVFSSFFTEDLPFSFVTIVSYLAFFYLAVVFLYKSFVHREVADPDNSSTNYELSEADALRIVRQILPPVNALFVKIRELFSGDPYTTLKLASVLWLLAECGHMMTIWTLIRIVYFVIFIVPKLYSSYSAQVYGYGEFLLLRFYEVWTACSHKKAVLVATAALAWNLSSVASRVMGAFIFVVGLRLYQHSLNFQADIQNEIPMQTDLPNNQIDDREITTLELVTITRAIK